MMDIRKAEEMLTALGSVLEQEDAGAVDIVVCGAMALSFLGITDRSTRDIDGLGLVVEKNGELKLEKPLMSIEFKAAVERVGSLYNEGKHWFSIAAIMLHDDTQLPGDIVEKAVVRRYGTRLVIRICSRQHMVFLKMWAAVRRGEPDIGDLVGMRISEEEAEAAAAWCLEQDVGALPVIREILLEVGHGDLVRRLG